MKNNTIILIAFLVLIVVVIAFFAMKNQKEVNTLIPEPTSPDTSLATQEGLPEAVEAKRQAIYQAALSRDYDTLADEADSTLKYSFGGPYEGGFSGFMKLSAETEGESAFDILPILLRLPYTENNGFYTWPSFFTKEATEWTEEDVVMMRTYLTEEEIESYRQFGAYIYYRVGIMADGRWVFYLAGD
ncbi:MAG TPA: hypothetical protein VFQ59_02515 [Candidatus Paceibacterota bacterium]|nr:hypothetical protein [Candidatus Paceibacterota bacterium]